MIAPHLLEQIERIALVRAHEEHIIGVRQQIEDVNGDRHTQKQKQCPPHILDTGSDLARHGQHDRVKGKKDMYRKGMPMHKVGKGQLRPRGKQKRKQCCGNADRVQEIIKGLGRLEYVNRDQENVDTAKLKRKVVFGIPSDRQKHDHLQDLIQQDQSRHGEAKAATSPLSAFFIAIADHRGDQQKCDQPSHVSETVMRKANSFFDRPRRFKKIFHVSPQKSYLVHLSPTQPYHTNFILPHHTIPVNSWNKELRIIKK